jgi:hypothetical protein
MKNHWREYPGRWGLVSPPLRPTPETVQRIQTIVGGRSVPALLLGVTPELAQAFEALVAVDFNPAMIAKVWPGDTATKRAIDANWLHLTAKHGSFRAVIGDGSLNNIACPSEIRRLLNIVMELLEPGGTFACRLFERPNSLISEDVLRRTISGRAALNFHAFKWMIAMHLAERHGANVPVAEILRAFEDLCPDRDRLSSATGWPMEVISTIDVYRGSSIEYSFPNRCEFEGAIPSGAGKVSFSTSGSYDLSECCPILSFSKPRE